MLADSLAIFPDLISRVFLQLEDEFDIVVIIPRCYMEMDVEYRLPRCPAVVREDIEPRGMQGIDKSLGNDSRGKYE